MMNESQRTRWINSLFEEYFDTLVIRACQYIQYDKILINSIEDCVIEAFELAWIRYEKIYDHPAILGWLTQVTYNKLDNIRTSGSTKMSRASIAPEDYEAERLLSGNAISDIDKWSNNEENKAVIQKILNMLSKTETEIFEDYFIREMKAKEIACQRNVAISAIKATIRRIRKKAEEIKKKNKHFMIIFGILFVFHQITK